MKKGRKKSLNLPRKEIFKNIILFLFWYWTNVIFVYHQNAYHHPPSLFQFHRLILSYSDSLQQQDFIFCLNFGLKNASVTVNVPRFWVETLEKIIFIFFVLKIVEKLFENEIVFFSLKFVCVGERKRLRKLFSATNIDIGVWKYCSSITTIVRVKILWLFVNGYLGVSIRKRKWEGFSDLEALRIKHSLGNSQKEHSPANQSFLWKTRERDREKEGNWWCTTLRGRS